MLAISSITITYAKYGRIDTNDDTGANGTGGGDIHTESTFEDVGTIHLFHVNQGFRVYIVNEQGLNVSNTVDFVKYRPWEMQACFSEGFTFEATQLMWNDYYNVTGIWNSPKNRIEYLGGTKTDSNFYLTEGQINKDGSIPNKKTGIYYPTREPREDSLAGTSEIWVSPGKMYTIAELESYLRMWISQDYGNWKITGTKELIEYIHPATGEKLQTYNQLLAPIEEKGTTVSGIMGTGEYMKNLMIMNLSEDYDEDNMTVLKYFISMSMPARNNIGELTGEGLQPLFFFTDSNIEKKYIELLDRSETEEDKKYAIIDTMREMKLKVAFEPVSWSVPTIVSQTLPSLVPGNKWNYTWTAHNIVYGTPTDVMWYCLDAFNEEYKKAYPESNIPPMTNYSDYLGWTSDNRLNVDWQWGLATYAYKTARDVPEYNMKAYNEKQIDPGDTWRLGNTKNRIGYGVMYFNIDVEAGTSTHTWDKITYPHDNYSPGSAPEPPVTEEGEDYKQLNKDHTFNIVKFYGEKDTEGNITYIENYVRENTVHNIKIDDELDYKVAGWFTSPELKIPSSDTESYDDYKSSLQKGLSEGDKEGHVIIKPDSADTTLYVKLIKENKINISEDLGNAKIILHEDELSYPYSMEDLKESLDAIWFSFPDKYDSGSHKYGSRPNRHTCHWERYLSDSTYHMTLRNGYDYGNTNFIGNAGIFSGTEGGKINTSDGERSVSISGFSTEKLIPNWLFTLYRDKSKDKVTLYPNKNNVEVIQDMGLIGIDSASYIPKDRIAKENNGNFKNSFTVKYFYESIDKKLEYDVSSDCGDHSGGSYNGTENLYIDVLNSNYSTADNTLTKYYLGKANTGNTTPESNNFPFTYDSKLYKSFMSTKLQANHNIKFYPMIRMTYQTQTTGEQDVFVTSTNESTVLAPTRIEVGVYRDSAKPGLLLDSTQWSTHAKTQSFLTAENIKDKNSVLPGGAIYDLKASKTATGKASDNWVGLHTYQVCIPDGNMERLSSVEGVLSESTARQQLNDFLSQVENVLEHYQIVQWVAPGIKTTEDNFKSASPVLVCGPGQASSFGGNTLDRSGKYYLKVDGTGADRSDLDIVGKSQDTITWTLSSDTDGNVTVKNDKGLSMAISKTEGAGSLLANADIKLLDDKTKVVTNFINAIDRNQGSNREGQKWYNESFEEIKVIENYAGFRLGFGNGQEARSSALDTKLTGKLDDRRDLYNFDEGSLSDKTRTSQFKTSARSTDPSAVGKAPGYIGSLDGMDIVIWSIKGR